MVGPTGPTRRAGALSFLLDEEEEEEERLLLTPEDAGRFAPRLVFTAMLSRRDSSSNFSCFPTRSPHLCPVRFTLSNTETGMPLVVVVVCV